MAKNKVKSPRSEKIRLRHCVTGVDIIDRLILQEEDPNKLMLLSQLRKEFKRAWQQ